MLPCKAYHNTCICLLWIVPICSRFKQKKKMRKANLYLFARKRIRYVYSLSISDKNGSKTVLFGAPHYAVFSSLGILSTERMLKCYLFQSGSCELHTTSVS